ncbi:MAG: hypothetical protein ACFFDN_01835 [Candidatus Hodarchaeota archaeon]
MIKENRVAKLLIQFFTYLNEEKINYCVLRNYEGYPETVGHDVDLIVEEDNQSSFENIINNLVKDGKWLLVKRVRRYSFCSYYFLIDSNSSHFERILKIDIWSTIHWKGITYIDTEYLFNKSFLNKNIFYVPNPGVEAAILLLKDLLQSGKVLEKYKKRISEFALLEEEGFIKSIEKYIGKKKAKFIFTKVLESNWKCLEENAIYLKLALVLKALGYRILRQGKTWIKFIYGHAIRYLKLKEGLFVVLIGPDGSGKSTLARGITKSELGAQLFTSIRYYHGRFGFIPQLRKFISIFDWCLKPKKKSIINNTLNTANVSFRLFRALIYPLYYSFDYFLGHFIALKARATGELIIFDRYFFDYMIQPHLINIPKWINHALLKIIPFPDVIFYLHNLPEVIQKRKPELTIKEIMRQSKKCKDLVERLSNGFIIETSCKPNEVIQKIQMIIIDKLKEKQGIYI